MSIVKLKALAIAALAIFVTACDEKPVDVTCAGIEGKSKKVASIPDEPHKLSSAGEGDTRTLELVTKFELKRHMIGIAGLELENIVISKDFRVSILDKDQKKICDLSLASDSAAISLKNLLKGSLGDAAEIKFAMETDRDEANEVLRNAKYFKVTNLSVSLRDINLSGDVGSYPVRMTLNIDADGKVTGAYYYISKGPDALLSLKGETEAEPVDLNEYDSQGNPTGEFHGIFLDGVFRGMFSTRASKFYNFTLRTDTQMMPIDTRSIPFDQFESHSLKSKDNSFTENNNAATGDIDDLLASYERCADRCISIMTKVKNNDPSAVAEYMGLLSEIADYTSRLDNLKGDLSKVQLDRLTRIAGKAAKIMDMM